MRSDLLRASSWSSLSSACSSCCSCGRQPTCWGPVATLSAVVKFSIDASCENRTYICTILLSGCVKKPRGVVSSSIHSVARLSAPICTHLHPSAPICTHLHPSAPICTRLLTPTEQGTLLTRPWTPRTRGLTRTINHQANAVSSSGSAQSRRRTCDSSVPNLGKGHSRS